VLPKVYGGCPLAETHAPSTLFSKSKHLGKGVQFLSERYMVEEIRSSGDQETIMYFMPALILDAASFDVH
jgi:hypothetical protein